MRLRLVTALLLATGAAAQTSPKAATPQAPPKPVPVFRADGPCKTLQLFFLVDAKVPVQASFMGDAVFPAAPGRQEQTGPFAFDCPEYKATYNGQILKITGKTLETALSVISGAYRYGGNITLTNSPGLMDRSSLDLSCMVIKDRDGTGCLYFIGNPDGSGTYVPAQPRINGRDPLHTQAIAVRQDGGALQPAWYQGRAVPCVIDRDQPYELYLTPDESVPFQKIRIDARLNELTFTRTSAFPVR